VRSYLQGLSENLGLLAAFLDHEDTAHPPWRLQATDPQDGLSGRSDAEDEIGEPDEAAEWAGDALQVKEAIQAGNAPLIASSLRDAAEILENLQRVLDPDRKSRSVWQLALQL